MDITYEDASRMMEEHAKELGYITERLSPVDFTAGGVHFRKTNIRDLKMIESCRDKLTTKKLVSRGGLRVPKTYNLKNIKFPAVVKPRRGTFGRGVRIVSNMYELTSFLNKNSFVEEFIEGIVYRVAVADGKAISILRQIRPNVVGDGKLSIKQLIEKKNLGRGETPADAPLTVFYKLDLNRVPSKGEVVYLHYLATRRLGGDVDEMVDIMDETFKEFSVSCVSCIPGCNFAGVDVIHDGKNTTLLEINNHQQLTAHYYPQGKTPPVEIHKFIVEAYLR